MGRVFNKLSGRKFSVIFTFFILSVIVVSFGILLSNCGHNPQVKVLLTDKGPFAIRMPMSAPACEADTSEAVVPGNINSSISLQAEKVQFVVTDSDYTIEAWVKVVDDGDAHDPKFTIFSFGGGDNGGGTALYSWSGTAGPPIEECPDDAPNGNCVKFYIFDQNNGQNVAVAIDNIVDGQWHHVAAVLNGTTMTVYIDGVVGTQSVTEAAGYPNPNVNGLRLSNYDAAGTGIGSDIGTNLINFQSGGVGNIRGTELGAAAGPYDSSAAYVHDDGDVTFDDVRLWNVARTPAQILACKDRELSGDGGDCGINPDILKGYWKFNTGEGATAADISGNGNIGAKVRCPFPGFECGLDPVDEDEDGIPDLDDKGDPITPPLPVCLGGWVAGATGL